MCTKENKYLQVSLSKLVLSHAFNFPLIPNGNM